MQTEQTEQTEKIVRQSTHQYFTQSLDELAVALALGAEVISVEKTTDNRFLTFNLKANFDMEEIMLSLASRTLEINAYSLCDALRRAKSCIHHKGRP